MAGDESVCDWSDSMGGSVTGDGGSRLGCNRRRIARLNWKRMVAEEWHDRVEEN